MHGQVKDAGPVLLRPILQQRVWGVTALPPWYQPPAPGQKIGEVWLTADECVIEGSGDAKLTLRELICQPPRAFLGWGADSFPLLVKMLFPAEKLSVQVHPDDAQARAMGVARGKTECWYVVTAEPGATVAVGFIEPMTEADIEQAIANETLEGKLRLVPVQSGDIVYVDAGTVHAIGPGLVILEIQQYSDVTFRLYDYGRDRELHVEQGLEVARQSRRAGLVDPIRMDGFTRLIRSPYFVVDRFEVQTGGAPLSGTAGFQILVALDEGTTVHETAGGKWPLPVGHALLLPAGHARRRLQGVTNARVIRIAQG